MRGCRWTETGFREVVRLPGDGLRAALWGGAVVAALVVVQWWRGAVLPTGVWLAGVAAAAAVACYWAWPVAHVLEIGPRGVAWGPARGEPGARRLVPWSALEGVGVGASRAWARLGLGTVELRYRGAGGETAVLDVPSRYPDLVRRVVEHRAMLAREAARRRMERAREAAG